MSVSNVYFLYGKREKVEEVNIQVFMNFLSLSQDFFSEIEALTLKGLHLQQHLILIFFFILDIFPFASLSFISSLLCLGQVRHPLQSDCCEILEKSVKLKYLSANLRSVGNKQF